MSGLDATHDPALQCWVPGAEGHAEFPVQNLPLGVFSTADGKRRCGTAIGDWVLDLDGLVQDGPQGGSLNAFLALGMAPRTALRAQASALLSTEAARTRTEAQLHPMSECVMHVPCEIGDYTDFYAGIHHAENVGRQFRPDAPLTPNYKHVPIGYHGRASSIRASGAHVRRPRGQIVPRGDSLPIFEPCRRLDYELELGVWIGPGNAPGDPIKIGRAAEHIAGYCLLNDWSARDIQGWEYQPLGPFLAKNFCTTISPWVVTPEALAPFRAAQAPRPQGDPAPLPYLADSADQADGALALALEVRIRSATMRERGLPAQMLSASHAKYLYWTPAQLVAHHTGGGCDLRPGDLFGTGTISGPDRGSCGSLLEASSGGREAVMLTSGEERRFLEDGDEIVLRAYGRRDGFVPIGFGACRGVITGSV